MNKFCPGKIKKKCHNSSATKSKSHNVYTLHKQMAYDSQFRPTALRCHVGLGQMKNYIGIVFRAEPPTISYSIYNIDSAIILPVPTRWGSFGMLTHPNKC
jgi:hypothetical protein